MVPVEIGFSVLGGLRMTVDGAVHEPRGPKVNSLLAVLLLRLGRTVDVGSLVDELWEDDPPRRPVTTLRTHVYHLRRFLGGAAGRRGEELLATRRSGYLLRAEPHRLDSEVFTRMAGTGRALLGQGRHAEAARNARAALELWRGRPLENASAGPLLRGQARRLDELRLQVVEQRIEAEMRLGAHRELVSELRGLVSDHPLNEWFHARLIEALERSGRRADAVRAFHELCAVLDAELGVGPSEELRGLHHRILTGAPSPRAA
ncbi:AfsR/SARP family transcriptional regulator [Actinorugispora endophytica]|uniref:DNA-binding SARP family transcriptional activator n=1 Tax=Actinorugispora endophytica TaxID=1605990 RepID=A0A4R6URT6_9ACTN|nr:AfsR/SARP family transcriptional regulator [Actinorugispora endophytica]TDQ48479.1 DNA-binding SARP family transcriptional activator [Actinorugispora endophytica]